MSLAGTKVKTHRSGLERWPEWLRALDALTEDPGSVPRTHMLAHSHLSVTPVPGDLTCSSVHQGQ